jgi:hypothetical protein
LTGNLNAPQKTKKMRRNRIEGKHKRKKEGRRKFNNENHRNEEYSMCKAGKHF